METAQILKPLAKNLKRMVQALTQGQIVSIPTETVYGLAGSIHCHEALTQIFEVKQRPVLDPLIVHVSADPSQSSWIQRLMSLHLIPHGLPLSEKSFLLEKLLKTFWPGPLTFVFPQKHSSVSDLITAGLPSIAIRAPSLPLTQTLLKMLQTPLAAPSANRFGKLSPTSAQAVFEELGQKIPWILDGGTCQIGLESTILGFDLETSRFMLLRPGAIERSALEAVLGEKIITYHSEKNHSKAQIAPGNLSSHYAPDVPLLYASQVFSEIEDFEKFYQQSAKILGFSIEKQNIALIFWSQQSLLAFQNKNPNCLAHLKAFSQNGSFSEIAQNFFAVLRQLNQQSFDFLICEKLEASEGLGYALQDRLQRAAFKGVS